MGSKTKFNVQIVLMSPVHYGRNTLHPYVYEREWNDSFSGNLGCYFPVL